MTTVDRVIISLTTNIKKIALRISFVFERLFKGKLSVINPYTEAETAPSAAKRKGHENSSISFLNAFFHGPTRLENRSVVAG